MTITDENGCLVEITGKEEMEQILMRTNKEKITQANNTLFMQPPLLQAVVLDGLTLDADKILQGTFPIPPGIHQGASDFITAVKMDNSLRAGGPISPDISPIEYQTYLSTAREATQSSMSRLHFGYYKATAKCAQLAQTVSSFVRIPYCTGFSPWRFRGDLNVSVMKEANNYKPEKRHTIHLLEANFSEGAKKSSVAGCWIIPVNIIRYLRSNTLERVESPSMQSFIKY